MPVFEIVGILLIGSIAWLWLDSLKAREIAVREAKALCASEGLLFLDDTVSIAALRPARDDEGQVTLQRAYQFEFSNNGDNRLRGSVVLHGHRVVLLNVGPRPVH